MPVSEELTDSRVYVARTGAYDEAAIRDSIANIAAKLGWLDEARGPFGGLIEPGDRVLVKPNWVIHENGSDGGITPLLTHQTIIRAVVEYALQAGASRVVLGDAPLQRCDFAALIAATELGEWASALGAREARFAGVRDYRRTRSQMSGGVRRAEENSVPEDEFVLFDLAGDSLLEPITTARSGFRVTQYDPRLMQRTHGPGRHQYLVARDAVESDVVINLPKLKTHRKAGVTCALKNLIGINGNKEFLPHHRLGGSAFGGDCYPGFSATKRSLEWVLDRQNQARNESTARAWQSLARILGYLSRLGADDVGVDGAWWGNDTIWRTCLDLNRILLYGGADAVLAERPRRRVAHIVDAVVAGHGDGPLKPEPLALGLLFAGRNAAAVDTVGARILGYNHDKIPIVREAFGRFHRPLTDFTVDQVQVLGDLTSSQLRYCHAARDTGGEITYPAGWLGAVDDRKPQTAAA